MSSVSPSVSSSPTTTPASVVRFAELVKKIGTSRTPRSRKAKTVTRKKLLRSIREQKRIARSMGLRAVALTLTIARDKDYSSNNISRFINAMREKLRRMGYTLPYAWVIERKSCLHYHLIVWLPRTCKLDDAELSNWWPWGFAQAESCRSVRDWSRYMAKLDGFQTLPKNAKSFGSGGLDKAGKLAVFRVGLPRWLATLLPTGHRARRVLGGGWVNAES